MKVDDLCYYLDWDSDFFGYRIARVAVHRLTHETIGPIVEWCTLHDIDCLYFLGEVTDAQTVSLAEDNGFRLVDIRVTLEKQNLDLPVITESLPGGVIRQSTPSDIPMLRSIAAVSHRDTRFYYDPNFPISLCSRLYETWIEKSCNGNADLVLVAEIEGMPVGYISCHLLSQVSGRLGLVGVNADYHGRRLGQSLVNASLRWFVERGRARVTVVTQGRNCRSQRLYQRCGFLTKSIQLWYHRWFPR